MKGQNYYLVGLGGATHITECIDTVSILCNTNGATSLFGFVWFILLVLSRRYLCERTKLLFGCIRDHAHNGMYRCCFYIM